MEMQKLFDSLVKKVLQQGAAHAAVIDTSSLILDASFRDLCASNACGMYGKCWMCPPDIGDIHTLMAQIQTYSFALVYQTIGQLEDSYDIEGMYEAGNTHNRLVGQVQYIVSMAGITAALSLGAGGCRVCPVCSKSQGAPCRFPDKAMSSLEAYGVNVSQMAASAGMKYTNGINTVTYFGAVFFNLPPDIPKHETIVTATINGQTHQVPPGSKLSDLLDLEIPCGGHGKCGKCKVFATGSLSSPTESERKLLGEATLRDGVRLACSTTILGDCWIQTLSSNKTNSSAEILTAGNLSVFETDPIFQHYGVAVDIGTTTLAAALYNVHGTCLSQKSLLNPQSVCGADVISRIEAAMNGEAHRLQSLILSAIDQLLSALASSANLSLREIDGLVITGNTAMLHLLAGESVIPLSAAPFKAARLFDESLTASQLGLSSLAADTTVYLPPCISAFVGADTACAILSTDMTNQGKTSLLVDIGTNGEIALYHQGRLIVCSTAAGPAFEGVGISMGMRGETGAIDKVWLEENCLHVHTIHEAAPIGICGSGLVDAIACLLQRGDLDETGYLDEDVPITPTVTITPGDIRMVQLAKGSLRAGINTLLHTANLTSADIPLFFIAGGFGNYLNIKNAATIGLLPSTLPSAVQTVGNAALSGASMLLLNKHYHPVCSSFAHQAQVLELSSNPVFTNEFMEQMMF